MALWAYVAAWYSAIGTCSQELGMPNVPQDWPLENYRDIETLNHWKE
jgi:hypothetical protein